MAIIKFVYENGNSQVKDFLRSLNVRGKRDPHYRSIAAWLRLIIEHTKIVERIPIPPDTVFWSLQNIEEPSKLKAIHPFKLLKRYEHNLNIYELRHNHIVSWKPKKYIGIRILFWMEEIRGHQVLYFARGFVKNEFNDPTDRMLDTVYRMYIDFLEDPFQFTKEGRQHD